MYASTSPLTPSPPRPRNKLTNNPTQGFFVYTFIVWLATLRSTLIFSSLILCVWMTFLMLGCAYLDNVDAVPNLALTRAGGAFGILASFLAWWAMLAGLLEPSNSFFLLPVVHFPWSAKGRERRGLEPLEVGKEE